MANGTIQSANIFEIESTNENSYDQNITNRNELFMIPISFANLRSHLDTKNKL